MLHTEPIATCGTTIKRRNTPPACCTLLQTKTQRCREILRRGCHVWAQAWELFFLVASVMPPSKEFVSLVSEYVHTVAHPDGPTASPEVQALAGKTWTALKRSAKAGPRRTVRLQHSCI